MAFTLTQTKEAYKKLSEEVQSFVLSSDNTEVISKAMASAGITGKGAIGADSEVLYAMYGLQSLSQAIENISKITNKSLADLTSFKDELKTHIFDKLEALPISNPQTIPTVPAGDTLQTIPEPAPVKTETWAPSVVVENPDAGKPVTADTPLEPTAKDRLVGSLENPTASSSPVNLIPPTPKEEGPLELLPPKAEPQAPNIEPPRKPVNQAYANGVDPYREPLK